MWKCDGSFRLGNDQRLLKKIERKFYFFLFCSMKCLALISTRCPTFSVSLWAKTGSLSLMFNSAIVFDERFCLDWDLPRGDICCKLSIYALPVKESRLEQQVSSLRVGIQSQKIFSLQQDAKKNKRVSPQTNRAFLCVWHFEWEEPLNGSIMRSHSRAGWCECGDSVPLHPNTLITPTNSQMGTELTFSLLGVSAS